MIETFLTLQTTLYQAEIGFFRSKKFENLRKKMIALSLFFFNIDGARFHTNLQMVITGEHKKSLTCFLSSPKTTHKNERTPTF